MCGIAGILDVSGRSSAEALARCIDLMTTSLRHRGPDGQGTFVDAEVGLALGHRRLSIIDLTEHGAQPMASHDGRYVISFNGEIYNFQAIRDTLTAKGARFEGTSDTEVMLEAIVTWGVAEALAQFNGMFAFALWDRRERTLWLARDRLGEKPLYYGFSGKTFLFGSELGALRAHPAFVGEVDRDALTLLLRHGNVPAPYSIFRGVSKLPPAHLLRLPLGDGGAVPTPHVAPYWKVSDLVRDGGAHPFRGSPREAVAELDHLLRDAVRLRMISDVPLGAFLSGGIDSSIVVALMQAQSTQRVQTYSIGFEEKGYDEAPFARAVADHLGTAHTELYVSTADVLSVIGRLPDLYDEPFADSSQIPTFLVSQLARREVTVALSGDGGDELFYGYGRYPLARDVWSVMHLMPLPVRRLLAARLASASSAAVSALFKPAEWLLSGKVRSGTLGDRVRREAGLLASATPEALYHNLNSVWKDPASVVIGAREPSTVYHDEATLRAAETLADRMMLIDQLSYLPDDILAKVDRASMAVALEVRVPLLDPRVVAFAWRLPFEMKLQGGKTKWLLRQVLAQYLPVSMIERPKQGFGIPIAALLRGPLRAWADDLLGEDTLRRDGYLSPAPIRARWADHLAGRFDWSASLWNVLAFQSWLRSGAPAPRNEVAEVGPRRAGLASL